MIGRVLERNHSDFKEKRLWRLFQNFNKRFTDNVRTSCFSWFQNHHTKTTQENDLNFNYIAILPGVKPQSFITFKHSSAHIWKSYRPKSARDTQEQDFHNLSNCNQPATAAAGIVVAVVCCNTSRTDSLPTPGWHFTGLTWLTGCTQCKDILQSVRAQMKITLQKTLPFSSERIAFRQRRANTTKWDKSLTNFQLGEIVV